MTICDTTPVRAEQDFDAGAINGNIAGWLLPGDNAHFDTDDGASFPVQLVNAGQAQQAGCPGANVQLGGGPAGLPRQAGLVTVVGHRWQYRPGAACVQARIHIFGAASQPLEGVSGWPRMHAATIS